MTEEEAKSKRCPLAAMAWERNHCLASNCMMWRWRNTGCESDIGHGYCGLANEETRDQFMVEIND